MPFRQVDPAAATNAFARQVQLGANMRANDQSEEMNALALDQARKAAAPQYDAQAFPKVGQIAAQISSLADPVQKRAAFRQAIVQNGQLFDTLGMPHADALAKLDQTDDATLDATLAKLATYAPQAAPQSVAAGSSLVRPDGKGGFVTAFTAPTATKDTDDIAEWKFSQSQGDKRSFRQYMAETKAAGAPQLNPPSGFRWNPDGSLSPITGGPTDPNAPKAPTVDEKRASLMFGSMIDAESMLAEMPKGGADTGSVMQTVLGSNSLTAPLQSDEFRKYESAGLRWSANLLYLKSGATASPAEIRGNWKQFFPQPGEGPDVAEQKNRARANELANVADAYKFDKSKLPKSPQAPGAGAGGGAPPANAGAAPREPVRVNTPEEAAKLPPGTPIILPDGRRKVVPGG